MKELLAALVASIATVVIEEWRARRRVWPKNLPAQYFKCRDCGLEHAVYPGGECHALRPIPKNPKRRPGIED